MGGEITIRYEGDTKTYGLIFDYLIQIINAQINIIKTKMLEEKPNTELDELKIILKTENGEIIYAIEYPKIMGSRLMELIAKTIAIATEIAEL